MILPSGSHQLPTRCRAPACLDCQATIQSRAAAYHQVRKLRHDLGKKKHDGGRQDDSER